VTHAPGRETRVQRALHVAILVLDWGECFLQIITDKNFIFSEYRGWVRAARIRITWIPFRSIVQDSKVGGAAPLA
jgi:hypothetical protein